MFFSTKKNVSVKKIVQSGVKKNLKKSKKKKIEGGGSDTPSASYMVCLICENKPFYSKRSKYKTCDNEMCFILYR
jgi:transposase